MFGRKNGFFLVCLLLLPVVTVSSDLTSSECWYIVWITTGGLSGAGTDDTIQIKIREDGWWHTLGHDWYDDFERYNEDMFEFGDDCIDRHQSIAIGSAGYGHFFVCLTDAWLVTHIKLMCLGCDWVNQWETFTWMRCRDQLILPGK